PFFSSISGKPKQIFKMSSGGACVLQRYLNQILHDFDAASSVRK
ncbi:hypothetical protein ACJ73_10136, partial [Blastomyces percursus]